MATVACVVVPLVKRAEVISEIDTMPSLTKFGMDELLTYFTTSKADASR